MNKKSKKIDSKKSISKLIQQIIQVSNRKNNPKQIIDDIIQLAFNCVFSGNFQYSANLHAQYWVDPNLLRELTEYKTDLEAWELLKEATMIFIALHKKSEPFTDIIGEMYDEYLGQVLGQFLTPSDLATALASITLALGGNNQITSHTVIGDTCGCGAGSLVLGSLRVIYQTQGKEALKHLEIVNMDLDPRMVQLSSIQIVLHCMFHGLEINSLNTHWGNTITEYGGRKDGSSTMAVYWKSNKNSLSYSSEVIGMEERDVYKEVKEPLHAE